MTDTTNDDPIKRLAKLVAKNEKKRHGWLFAIALFGLVTYGWAISVLWGLFIAPLGIPAITIAHGAGLHVLSVAIKANLTGPDIGKLQPKDAAINVVMNPAILVFMGWVVSKFI